MTEITADELKTLTQWDTPTICNALEITSPERRGYGFTVVPFACLDPALPAICGFARTAKIRAAQPATPVSKVPNQAASPVSSMPRARLRPPLLLIEASEASLFTYLQGVVAIPVAWLFLAEIPTWPMIIAIFIISFGVYLAEYRPKRYNRNS